jgi:hypothetical protein
LDTFNEIAGWSLNSNLSQEAKEIWKEFVEFLKKNIKKDYEYNVFNSALNEINREAPDTPPENSGTSDFKPYMIYKLNNKREIELLKEGVSNEKLDILLAFMIFAADKTIPFEITVWKEPVEQYGMAYNKLDDLNNIRQNTTAIKIDCKDNKIKLHAAHVEVVWKELSKKK